MNSAQATMPRNYHAEILAAHKAGDADTLAALALELAQRTAVADELERREVDRKARRAQQKQAERMRHRATSRDNERQDATSATGSSPLVPPSPLPTPNPSSPLNPPFSVAETEGREVRTGQTTRSATRRASWLADIAPSWEAKFGTGSFPWGKAGKALKPLHDAGHSPPEIAERLTRYLAKTEPQFLSLHRFAETYGEWEEFHFTMPPIIDGWMSPELERLTRPQGYAA